MFCGKHFIRLSVYTLLSPFIIAKSVFVSLPYFLFRFLTVFQLSPACYCLWSWCCLPVYWPQLWTLTVNFGLLSLKPMLSIRIHTQRGRRVDASWGQISNWLRRNVWQSSCYDNFIVRDKIVPVIGIFILVILCSVWVTYWKHFTSIVIVKCIAQMLPSWDIMWLIQWLGYQAAC